MLINLFPQQVFWNYFDKFTLPQMSFSHQGIQNTLFSLIFAVFDALSKKVLFFFFFLHKHHKTSYPPLKIPSPPPPPVLVNPCSNPYSTSCQCQSSDLKSSSPLNYTDMRVKIPMVNALLCSYSVHKIKKWNMVFKSLTIMWNVLMVATRLHYDAVVSTWVQIGYK